MEVTTLSSLQWNLIAGGLAIFLYGINLMGDSLTNFAGPKLKGYIEKYTSSPRKGILVGLIITGIIQSSSATTVIAISFVRAEIMTLEQAMGVILGANIGTTVTAILIGFNLNYYSYYICLVGVIISLFSKKKRNKFLGDIIVGFGLLFVGLNMMGDSLTSLKDVPGFSNMVVRMSSNPVLGVLVGALITGVIQSSSAFVGIIQSLYASGAITVDVALALVFGANIGTCVTGLLASIGGSKASLRTSLFHILFNVTISILGLIFIAPYTNLVVDIATRFNLNKMMEIAVGHFLFNFFGMLIFAPFIKQVSGLLYKLIPGKDTVFDDIEELSLDENLIKVLPAEAITQAERAIIKESELAFESLKASQDYLLSGQAEYVDKLNEAENLVNRMDTEIETYLLNISQENLSEDLEHSTQIDLQVQINVERVSDLSQNLIEYYLDVYDNSDSFSKEGLEELNTMYALLMKNYNNAIEVYKHGDMDLYRQLEADEQVLDDMEYALRKSHYDRIKAGKCDTRAISSTVFIDVVSTMERIGDHAFNIARNTINPVKIHEINKTLEEVAKEEKQAM